MRRTLLLVFIHGFKGGDDTFGTFPDHIRALLSHALPKINVVTIQYPKFETRGDLKECVLRFREWLENKVIDLEVANGTPSPTVDPCVHTILVGHSMGGIVAAETLLLLAGERPISTARSDTKSSKPISSSDATMSQPSHDPRSNLLRDDPPSSPSFMFPHIQGVLAFDTPYLGLAPEMVAHGLEGGHKMASSAWDTANDIAGIFGYGSKTSAGVKSPATTTSRPVATLPAPVKDASADAAATPRWQSWGKYAMFAGAAGAIAAGGAAALYSQKGNISAGWGWATSHLLFVGDLARPENLKKRVEMVEQIVSERGIGGYANFYTNLGRGAREGYGITDNFAGRERTFCNLPRVVKEQNTAKTSKNTDWKRAKGRLQWLKAVNEKAKDETSAHMSMFFPRENPGFYSLGEGAVEVVSSWLDEGWYLNSDGPDSADNFGDEPMTQGKNVPQYGSLGKDWEGLDRRDVHGPDDEDVEMTDQDKQDRDELEDSVLIENMRSSGNLKSSHDLKKGENETPTVVLPNFSEQEHWADLKR